MKHSITIIFLLLLLSCCSKYKNDPFSGVVRHYDGDSLRKEAALYLARYSSLHSGTKRYIADGNGNLVTRKNENTLHGDSVYLEYLKESDAFFYQGNQEEDKETVSESFLIDNIELAFDSWAKPWSKDVGFEDFCRYILPYRVADEPLSEWRRWMKDRYEPSIPDSVDDPADVRKVAEYVMREIRRDIHYSTVLRDTYEGFLTPQDMLKLKGLECRACAHYTTLAMRACGIPCAMIEIHWRFTEIPHTTVYFPKTGNNRRSFRLTVGDTLIYMGEPKDTMATWRTWCYSYEPNPLLQEMEKGGSVPEDILYPLTRLDLTSQVSKTYRFEYPVPSEYRGEKYLFLCRFHDWKWYAIREGKVEGDIVSFENATIRHWYRLGAFKNGRIRTFGDTFTILGDGRMQKYDLMGDSVIFKMVYGCNPDEKQLTKTITTYYWGHNNEWEKLTKEASLWGLNKKTGEYRLFEESMNGSFVPVFHLLQVKLPCWTVFTDNETPRPLGYIDRDSISNEAYFMQF